MWVYELLTRMKPTRTLEIGGYTGCSSSAFVAAGVPDAHFAEISPNEKFRSVVLGNGTIHQRKGCDVIRDEAPFDVILVDGAHDMDSVMEELHEILAKPPKVIIAHDIGSTDVGYPHCEGARHLYWELARNGWDGECDWEHRDGERTERGLMIVTKDDGLIELISEAKEAAGCS